MKIELVDRNCFRLILFAGPFKSGKRTLLYAGWKECK